jgi:hypothetical protein
MLSSRYKDGSFCSFGTYYHVHIKHLMKTTYNNSHIKLEDIAAPTVEDVYYFDTQKGSMPKTLSAILSANWLVLIPSA